jgi:predicted aconitase with swiveling domain
MGVVAQPVRHHPEPPFLATVGVEGRTCGARALPGSGRGSATGLVVFADSEDAVRDAGAWMPGRILVLSDEVGPPRVVEALIAEARATTFAAIVVLCADDALPLTGQASATIPVVAVSRESDQEWVRRAVRVRVTVDEAPRPPVPSPRRRPRRVAGPVAAGMPGTIRT